MSKYGLALHSSTPELGLAMGSIDHETDYRFDHWPLGRATSDVLHSYIAKFILPQTWGDIAWVSVGIGPGGFTGTRLAVVTARTIGQQLQIPVYGISNLSAVAWAAELSGDIAVMMPAQRDQVYMGIYRCVEQGLATIEPARVMDLPASQNYLQQFMGNQIILEAGIPLGHTVDSVWKLAQMQWQAGQRPSWHLAEPFYGQQPLTI